jgi:ubiquitin thioesterase protein OTUB1
MMERNFMDADIISTFCEPLMDLVDAVGNANPNQVLTHDRLLSAFLEDESKFLVYSSLPAADTLQRQTVLSRTCDF